MMMLSITPLPVRLNEVVLNIAVAVVAVTVVAVVAAVAVVAVAEDGLTDSTEGALGAQGCLSGTRNHSATPWSGALQPSWPVPRCCHPTGRHTASPASCHPPVSKSDYGSPNTLAILKNQVNTGSRTCGHPGHRWSGLGTGKPAPPYHRRNRLTYWAANCNQCLHTVERRLSPRPLVAPGDILPTLIPKVLGSKSSCGSPNTSAILKNQVDTGSRTCGHPGHQWFGLGTGKPAPPHHRRNRLT